MQELDANRQYFKIWLVLLTKSNRCNHYSVTETNQLDTLQDTSERHTPNDKYEEKARWELHKDAAYYFKQILKVAPY